MSEEKPLQEVPKGVKYLRVFCHGCDTLPGNLCRKTLLPISNCKYGARQKYKIIKYEGKVRRTTTLETRDLKTAISMIERPAEVSKTEAQIKYIEQPVSTPAVSNTPVTLIDWLARYTGILNGDKEVKSIYSADHEYSLKHLQDHERYQKYLLLSLKEMGKDAKKMRVGDIGEAEIKNYQNYLLKKLNLSEVSHDKAIRIMGSFFSTIKKLGYDGRNVFAGIPRKAKGKEVEIVTDEEIMGMLKLLDDPDLKNHVHPNGKSMKKSFNKHALLLGIFTGRRNNEIVDFRWNNLAFDSENQPTYLKCVDLKVSRRKGIEKNPKMVYIPVIPELKNLLAEMGMDAYRNSSDYILASKENLTRDTIKLHLSRMFTFYYDKLNTGKQKQYKHLRKKYISTMASKIGVEATKIVSGHSGFGVMGASYLSPETLSVNEATKNLSILNTPTDNRMDELKSVRKQPVEKSIER